MRPIAIINNKINNKPNQILFVTIKIATPPSKIKIGRKIAYPIFDL